MYLAPCRLHKWWHWLGRPLLAASVEVLGVPGAVRPQDGLLRHAAPLLGHDQARPRGGGRGSGRGRGGGGALHGLLLLLSVLQEVVQHRQPLVLTGHGTGVLGVVVRVGGWRVIWQTHVVEYRYQSRALLAGVLTLVILDILRLEASLHPRLQVQADRRAVAGGHQLQQAQGAAGVQLQLAEYNNYLLSTELYRATN